MHTYNFTKMAKKFRTLQYVTKIFVCKKLGQGNYQETLIDVRFVPTDYGDSVSLSDVATYWQNVLSRSEQYPKGVRYRIQSHRTWKPNTTISTYFFK